MYIYSSLQVLHRTKNYVPAILKPDCWLMYLCISKYIHKYNCTFGLLSYKKVSVGQ